MESCNISQPLIKCKLWNSKFFKNLITLINIIDAYLFWNDIFILIHYIFDVIDHGLVMIVWEKWHLLQPNIAFHMSLNISFVFFLMKVKLYFFYCMNFCNIIWLFFRLLCRSSTWFKPTWNWRLFGICSCIHGTSF